MEEGIALMGNCLDRNIDKMYDIFTKLILETNFDDAEKLKTLIIGVRQKKKGYTHVLTILFIECKRSRQFNC